MKRLVIFMLIAVVVVAFFGRAILAMNGFTVTSWFRTPWGNASVDGKTFSLHQIGWAWDVVPVNSKLQALLDYWPFKYVVESDHIHIQFL
jgi:hypothetical protein